MQRNIIASLIKGSWEDPLSGRSYGVPIGDVQIQRGLVANADMLLNDLEIGRKLAVVADSHTDQAAGSAIRRALEGSYEIIEVMLTHTPKADDKTVAKVREAAARADAYIAVGSGTINDICKYASFLDGKPYLVFGTAPSMNGYASANAAIMVDGHKQSLQAQLPLAIFLDLDVLAAAPARLIRSGLGDSLCRSTAQVDWLFSHLLWDTPYSQVPFTLLSPYEPMLFDNSKGLINSDINAIESLAYTLVLSGVGMYLSGGSFPASQGEHLIAHTMEMVHPALAAASYHGEQIAVTTLTMAGIQEKMLEKCPHIKVSHIQEGALEEYFGKELAASCLVHYREKMIDKNRAEKVNERLKSQWNEIEKRLRQVMIPAARLHAVMAAAGGACQPKDLRWDNGLYHMAVSHAKYMRNRFTFLDVA